MHAGVLILLVDFTHTCRWPWGSLVARFSSWGGWRSEAFFPAYLHLIQGASPNLYTVKIGSSVLGGVGKVARRNISLTTIRISGYFVGVFRYWAL